MARFAKHLGFPALLVLVQWGCASPDLQEADQVALEVPLEVVQQDHEIELAEKLQDYDLYPIPEGSVLGAPVRARALPRAREIIGAGLTRQLSVRRVRDEYWLTVELPPSSVWPALKSYVISRRSGLAAEDPQEGVLLSNWLDREGGRYRFAYQVDGGMVPGSAEIQLLVFPEGGPENQPLSQEQAGPLVSGELRELLAYLVEAPASTGSLVVQHLDFRSRLSIDLRDNLPQVTMTLSKERAWLLIREAIERSDLVLLAADPRALEWEVGFFYESIAKLPSLRHVDRDSWGDGFAADLVRLQPKAEAAARQQEEQGAGTYRLRLHEEEAGIRLHLDPGGSFRIRRALLSSLVRNLR